MKKVLIALALGMVATGPSFAETISADVWADNWFALYVNDHLVKEDSVSIKTERSFNKESFSFSATRPFALNFIAKDFKANDTGLEYIGTNRQQMGDGGLIAQFASGNKVIAVTNADWKCMVVHSAPLDKSCERSSNPVAGQGTCKFDKTAEPSGWKNVDFNDSAWKSASVYSERQVGPKDGYDQVRWSSSAKLIWGPDLEQSNTILCRIVIK